jgi:carbon monoxide dehydrogenase subunit G
VKISGQATLHGSVDEVYKALTDPAVLVRTIPGCERLEQVSPDVYTAVVSAGVAAVRGTYNGEVVLTDQRPPHEFVLKASGSGAPGTAAAEARIRLAGGDNGTTTVTYEAEAVVGGMVGGVGQRVLTGVARKTAGEFFSAVDDVLTGKAVAEPVEAGSPTVFTRPDRVGGILTGGSFAAGVVFGAAAGLVGVIVGGLLARRPTRRE